jgi:hypothetical protein
MRCAANNVTGRTLPAFNRLDNTPTACTLGTAQNTEVVDRQTDGSRLHTATVDWTDTAFFHNTDDHYSFHKSATLDDSSIK